MSSDPKLFRVNRDNVGSESVREVEFAHLDWQERRDIQERVAANPTILGDDLLIINKEFSDFDRTRERLDLLAVDADGKVVIIELKRDDSGADVHWQAIKYASYFARATAEDISNILSSYARISLEEAKSQLRQHLGADDLNALNNDQRIILASHRFAPEVTNAVLWLNEKARGGDFITCVKLTPYLDGDSLYLQASRLIPVPDTEGLLVGIRNSSAYGSDSFRPALGGRDTPYQNDDISRFLIRVAELARNDLPASLNVERQNRFALGGSAGRTFQVWHNRSPWGQNRMYYRIALYPVQGGRHPNAQREIERWCKQQGRNTEDFSYPWLATVYLHVRRVSEPLKAVLNEVKVDEYQAIPDYSPRRWFNIEVDRVGDSLDEAFADTLAATLRRFIEVVTPAVDDFFENEGDEAEV